MWQERFSHILIDEFQDINPVQYDILKLLAKAPYQIFAVGDDDQSIYGFRGASTRCIRQFVEEFSAKQIVLDVNYRSKKLLIDQAKAVIEMSKDRFAKTLRAGRADVEGGACEILSFQNSEDEYTWLGERIKEEWGTQKTVGVLFRTNAAMQKFAAYLRRYEIPYVMKEQEKSIYDHFVFRDLWAYLSLAQGDRSKEDLLRIINKPYRGIDRELVPCSGMTLLNRQLKTIEKFPLHLAVEYICKQVGYERYLLSKAGNSRETWEEWSELLAWVKSEARQFASLKEWELARAFSKKHQMAKANQSNIHLMTAHASKGLEFDCVYLPDCNEGTYPYGRMPDDAAVEEELRIFYVAMTRAKNSLGLLYLTGTEQSPRHPSRFIQPLLHPR
jgi:DNA helicase-2/ATP-dependent DNA helicase PcrA